jgi:hypothetical protein
MQYRLYLRGSKFSGAGFMKAIGDDELILQYSSPLVFICPILQSIFCKSSLNIGYLPRCSKLDLCILRVYYWY